MTVQVKRHKIKGELSKAIYRHGDVTSVLNKQAQKYMQNATAASGVYSSRLGEYLNYYMPQIEDYYDKQVAAQGDSYYDRSIAARDLRISTAVAVSGKTAELAKKWRKDTNNRRGQMKQGTSIGYVRSDNKRENVIRL